MSVLEELKAKFETKRWFKKLYKEFSELIERENNDDYEVNEIQMKKFENLVDFLESTAKQCRGKIESVNLSPRELHGGVSALFSVFDLSGNQIEEFAKHIGNGNTSALSIDSLTDGTICIGLTVPNLFYKKQ